MNDISRYARTVGSPNDSLTKIANMIPEEADVLDVGVGWGALGEYLTDSKRCRVDGIDSDRQAVARCRRFYKRLFLANVEECELEQVLGGQKYSYIVCADVLEHLVDPLAVLKKLANCLRPDGKILISIPNVSYAGLVSELASGEFRYRENGLLDSTHLRHYTWSSFKRLVADAGLSVVRSDVVTMDLSQSEFDTARGAQYLKLEALMRRPHAMTYQFVVETKVGRDSEAGSDEILQESSTAETAEESRYINLMKRVLLNLIYQDPHSAPWGEATFDLDARTNGRDCPRDAHTMVGMHRLNNIQRCVETILTEGVPGDFVETGVWRGGCAIFMRAMLADFGITNRTVWLCDSFRGLPPPDPESYPADAGLELNNIKELAVSQAQVRENFSRYGLLDDQVRFVEGWFRDTLPNLNIDDIALLRLDGDLYESTMVALQSLYCKVAPGGFVIVDDYFAFEPCKQAVEDFRKEYCINDPIEQIDWTSVFWRKS